MSLPGFFRNKLPMVFQTEAAECGMACLAMVAGFHGKHVDLLTLRQRFSVSLRGATLAHIVRFASSLDFTARPLRLELEELPNLQTPCILHWNMDHFVVLKKATSKYIFIHDPALGPRRLSLAQVSRQFTGVALELTPTASFQQEGGAHPLRIGDLIGQMTGLKRALAQVFFLAFLLEIFSLVSPLFLQLSIDKVVNGNHRGLLFTLGVGFVLLIGLQTLLGALRSWTTLFFGTELRLRWYARLFSHLVRLPVSFFEKRNLGDIISRFDSAEAIQRTLSNNFIEALLDGLISFLVLGVMFVYSPRLATIVVGAVVIYVLLRKMAYARLRCASEEYIVNLARQQSHFIETLRGIRTIKVFGREDLRKTRWMNLLVDTTNAQVSTEKLQIAFKSANTLIFGIQSVVVVWLGVVLVLNRVFSIGMLFAFVAYQEQFKARMITLVDRIFEFRMLSLQVQRLSDIVFAKPEPKLMEPAPIEPLGTGIEVRSLYFRYSDVEPWLLENVSFRIEANECVAITGPSGAGKSTLLKLIAGLLQPQQGDILIDGRSVCASRTAVLGKVGFVLQDDMLFAGTIADNIAFASDVPDMSKVRECARVACLDREIEAMPMGYNTLVGDMGSALSGGQQQRVLLARAVYQEPSILILDEATSHMDVPMEKQIARMLSSLRMTRVFAAHRPDTIASADRVISLRHAGQRHSQDNSATVAGMTAQSIVDGLNTTTVRVTTP